MGTLTGNTERLPHYCEHKLPTSCRLTSIPRCCACADERPHAPSYSTYVDGVGFVPWGTRWQRYCWYCREFWAKRVEVSGVRPAQTRIPEVPDQTDFLEKWYDFHRGFRIVNNDAGEERRVAVLGEAWRDVDPGCLPRTIEEMRAGRRAQEAVIAEHETTADESEQAGPSLDETLDQMFQDAAAEDSGPAPVASQIEDGAANTSASPMTELMARGNVHAQVMNPVASRNRDYQARRVAALRRELQRMRTGIERVISGLRDLGEAVPDHGDATSRLTALGQRLESLGEMPSREESEQAIESVDAIAGASQASVSQTDQAMATMQQRVDEARQQQEAARRSRDAAATELDAAEQEFRTSRQRLQRLQREQRTADNYLRLFGTREEMIAQGDQYESPIGGMFNRAYERFRAAEQVRREERNLRRVLEDELRAGASDLTADHPEAAYRWIEEGYQRDVWGVPRRPNSLNAPARLPESSQMPESDEPPPRRLEPTGSPRATDPTDVAERSDGTHRQLNDLEEYYAQLRRQDWHQRPSESVVDYSRDIAAGLSNISMQDTYGVTERLHESATDAPGRIETMSVNADSPMHATYGNGTAESGQVGDNEGATRTVSDEATVNERLDLAETAEVISQSHDDFCDDARKVIAFLERVDPTSDPYKIFSEIAIDAWPNPQTEFARLRDWSEATSEDNAKMRQLLNEPAIAWPAGIPAARLQRMRARGRVPNLDFWVGRSRVSEWLEGIECMAEAFQVSAVLRRRAPGLAGPEQLRMLYRLQASIRDVDDLRVLESMLNDRDTRLLACRTHRDSVQPAMLAQIATSTSATEQQRQDLDARRRESAREGDHSRAELDASRQATQAFAVAAGRTAMRTGPDALIERMAAQDAETREAYERLRENGWAPTGSDMASRTLRSTMYRPFPSSPSSDASSASEDEEGEEAGLDARDTGRPEPRSDEEMKVSMECRICYTQLAEIACLPCGHLVMCKWCSDQHSPCMPHDRTRPRRAAGCPVCRKGIRQKVRVFRA
jgi:hypothetical protein